MTYYINPIWFYLMGVSTGLKIFLGILGGLPLIFIFIAWWDITDSEILKSFKKIMIASIITLFISILLPSKETCVEMMVASQVTHENVTATKEEIYEIIDYVTDKVKGEDDKE